MNKYLKALMLSGGLIGAIAPTAINTNKNSNSDLGYIYSQVGKIQEVLPRLSRININLDDTSNEQPTDVTEINDNSSNDNIEVEDILNSDNLDTENSNLNNSIDYINNQEQNGSNVTFSTTDDDGNVTDLTNAETLNYLEQTLIQTNTEYEELKTCLSNAIKDTMDYLEAYRNGEYTLTNEQKVFIKEHSNSIKFLAETLEDLSEEIICVVDCKDCKDCDDEFDEVAGNYLTTIKELENRIFTLQNAISSLQFINNLSNPFFNRNGYIMYHHFNDLNAETEDAKSDNAVEVENTNDTAETESDDTTNQDNVDNSEEPTNSQASVSNTEEQKPTTFGLKSNIDTYAPTKRNIDTFFNTALLNDEYMYGGGYGYGMPYGYGSNYAGYGAPYGGFGNPYNRGGLNSNIINRATLEKEQNETNASVSNIDNESHDKNNDKPKKFHAKRAKNVDTYDGITIKSNINTMGESKISNFIKEKFSKMRNRVKNQKNELEKKDQFDLSDTTQTEQTEINSANLENIDNSQSNNFDTTASVNDCKSNVLDNSSNNNDSTQNIDSSAPIYADDELTR